MPLVRIDLVEGRTAEQLKRLSDLVHEALVFAFHIAIDDRYQIITEHRKANLIARDNGLGFTRTSEIVLLSVTSRPKSELEKINFYQRLNEGLREQFAANPGDLVVNITTNGDADWSFGSGRAQFLTGELNGGPVRQKTERSNDRDLSASAGSWSAQSRDR